MAKSRRRQQNQVTSPKNKTLSADIILAIGSNDKKTVKRIITPNLVTIRLGDNGASPLIDASGWGYAEMVKLLLDRGAQVDFRDDEGVTALISAAALGHAAIVRLLLQSSADVNARSDSGI